MPLSSARLFIFAGEPSGDLHGSRLITLLKEKRPGLSIEGVSGPKMRKEGVQGILRMEDFEVMGFSDVLIALPRLYKHFHSVLTRILNTKPDGVVLIDYPGFNLRLAKALRKKGFSGKIIHYISPSVWAWGRHRIEEMEKTLDLLLTIFPFESAYFTESKLEVCYVGSPIKESITKHHYDNLWLQKYGIAKADKLIALFPGSRKGEISRNLPLILEAAELLKKNDPELIFGISCFNSFVHSLLAKNKDRYSFLENSLYCISNKHTYELMRDSRAAIAKSGTTTLELAIHSCPTVVVYKLTSLNRIYAKYFLKVNLPHYCIVNILAGKKVFPELIVEGLNASNLLKQIQPLINEGHERRLCIHSCEEINASLGNGDASSKAAESILGLLTC